MYKIPHSWATVWPWLQATETRTINPKTNGIEDVADEAIALAAQGQAVDDTSPEGQRLRRRAANRRTTHRHREELERVYAASPEADPARLPDESAALREAAQAALSLIAPEDSALLLEIADGEDYAAIAARRHQPVGTIKALVSRTRALIRHSPVGQEIRAALNW
jgi:DNA-directed RNA polymerase specialized sigma24 family protein